MPPVLLKHYHLILALLCKKKITILLIEILMFCAMKLVKKSPSDSVHPPKVVLLQPSLNTSPITRSHSLNDKKQPMERYPFLYSCLWITQIQLKTSPMIGRSRLPNVKTSPMNGLSYGYGFSIGEEQTIVECHLRKRSRLTRFYVKWIQYRWRAMFEV